MVMWKLLRQVHVLMPEELLVEVDAAALDQYMSRSEYIRRVLDNEVRGKYREAIAKAAEKDPARFLNVNDI